MESRHKPFQCNKSAVSGRAPTTRGIAVSRTWIRWIIVGVLVLAAFALWRSGLLAELNLQGLKARIR